jgi:hypothetical protein
MPPQPPPLRLTKPKKNPKIIGRYKVKPVKVSKKFLVKKRGGGKGYVTVLNPNYKAPTPAPTPAAPTGPYAEYAAYPWAQQQLKQLDTDQKFHQTYVSDKVAPWLSQSLTNLTGVDPTKPGINASLQQQYLANVQGQVGGALSAAAAAGQAPNMAATTPGGIMASPTAYLSQAASEGARGMSSSYLQSAQIQSALNTMQPNLMSQSYVMQLADYAKGLPTVYAEKRSELRSSIDKFIAEMEQEAAQQAETLRHNRVTESISAMNAETQAALGFGRLGVSSTQAANTANNVTGAEGPFAAGSTPPVGKQAVTGTDGLTYFVDDPSYVAPSSGGSGGGSGNGTSTRDAQGRSRAPVLRDQGWSGGYAKKPKVNQAVFALTQGADNKWYVKRKSAAAQGTTSSGGGTGSGSTKKVRSEFSLSEDLLKKWRPSSGDGIELRFDSNWQGAGKWLSQWIRENKVSFTTKNGKIDVAKMKKVLAAIGGRPAGYARDIIERGYMTADGRWK